MKVGVGSFLLIRRQDITSKVNVGIIARSLGGILVGLVGVLLLWLYVGHRVIGFYRTDNPSQQRTL
jgi:hypothetical protein